MYENCSYYKLYDDQLQIRFCPDKHIYHIRPIGSQFTINEDPEMDTNAWLYTPSVTSICRMLGGSKVDGLLWWAVTETLKYLDYKLEDELIIPSIEKFLDCFISRIQANLNNNESEFISTSLIEDVLNSLDNCISMDQVKWKSLRANASNARDRSLDQQSSIGTQVHNWIELYIKYQLNELTSHPTIPLDPTVKRAIKKWIQWEEDSNIEWIQTEQKVYSNEWHYTGTYDALAYLDNKLTIIDFKTSKKIYDEHRFQLSAYAKAIEEEYEDDKIEQRLIVRLSKENGNIQPTILETESTYTIDDDFNAFIGLRTVYRRLKGA